MSRVQGKAPLIRHARRAPRQWCRPDSRSGAPIPPKIDTDARGRRFALSLKGYRRRQRPASRFFDGMTDTNRASPFGAGPFCCAGQITPQREMITPQFTPRRISVTMISAKLLKELVPQHRLDSRPHQTQGLGLRNRQAINNAQSASRSGSSPRDHYARDAARRNRVRVRL